MNYNALDSWLIDMTAGSPLDVPRVAGVTGSLVYATVETLDKLLSLFGIDLGGRTKLAMSLIGAVAVPVGALWAVKKRGLYGATLNMWFLVAAAASWSVSQIVHGALERNKCEP